MISKYVKYNYDSFSYLLFLSNLSLRRVTSKLWRLCSLTMVNISFLIGMLSDVLHNYICKTFYVQSLYPV